MAGREKRKRRKLRERRRNGSRPAGDGAGSFEGDSSPRTGSAPTARNAGGGPRAAVEGKSKDDLAREELAPLREGERPTAVTVAALAAALIAISNVIAFAAGLEVEGTRPRAVDMILPTGVMLVAAVGMWYARYWAVLGFQAILAILIVIMSLLLMRAENLLAVLVAVAIIAACGTLFWFLVKSLAQIQMPDRRPPEG